MYYKNKRLSLFLINKANLEDTMMLLDQVEGFSRSIKEILKNAKDNFRELLSEDELDRIYAYTRNFDCTLKETGQVESSGLSDEDLNSIYSNERALAHRRNTLKDMSIRLGEVPSFDDDISYDWVRYLNHINTTKNGLEFFRVSNRDYAELVKVFTLKAMTINDKQKLDIGNRKLYQTDVSERVFSKEIAEQLLGLVDLIKEKSDKDYKLILEVQENNY